MTGLSRPVDLARLALGHADRRPVGLEVEELLGVDRARPARCRASRATASSAVLAALAASFQPAKAATSTGERSSAARPPRSTGPRSSLARTERRSGAVVPMPSARDSASAAWRQRVADQIRRRPTVAELRPGQRFEGRFACVRKDRLTARNGSAYLSLELRDRTGSIPARVFRDADRLGARFERGDAIDVAGKVERFRGRARRRARRRPPARARRASTRPSSCPSAYRSVEELEGFLEHLIREIHDPALRGVGRAASLGRAGRRRVPPRAVHPRRPPRLPRRPARAHGRGRHAGRRALPAPPAARLRPADGGGAAPRHRQDARVHLRRRVRDQRRGRDARPPGDRRRDHRRRGRRAASRAAAGAAALRAHPPRPRGRAGARSRGDGRAASPRPRRWRSPASTPSTRRSRGRSSTGCARKSPWR